MSVFGARIQVDGTTRTVTVGFPAQAILMIAKFLSKKKINIKKHDYVVFLKKKKLPEFFQIKQKLLFIC